MRLEGREAICTAMMYRQNDRKLQVVLWVAEFDEAFPANVLPSGAVRLDGQRQASLIREHEYQEVLAQLPFGLMWATLAPGTVESGKYKGGPTIDVFIEGAKVGQLTAGQGSRYASVLGFGSLVACEAVVYAGRRTVK